MRNQDRIIATIIFSMLVVLWLGFLVHRSSFFAGSLLGGVFGVVGAAFMLVPLTYTVIKRSATLRRAFTRKHGFGALLQAHVYFGLVGALLAILHSGHKFQSALGVALTASMLLSVLTGFIGQHYLRYVAENIREKKAQIDGLWRLLDGQYWAYAQGPTAALPVRPRPAPNCCHWHPPPPICSTRSSSRSGCAGCSTPGCRHTSRSRSSSIFCWRCISGLASTSGCAGSDESKGKILAALLAVLAPVSAVALWTYLPQMQRAATWQNMASPGPCPAHMRFSKRTVRRATRR